MKSINIIAFVLFSLLVVDVNGQSLEIDSTFGINGSVIYNPELMPAGGFNNALDIASTGEIIISRKGKGMYKFHQNGDLDESFGIEGYLYYAQVDLDSNLNWSTGPTLFKIDANDDIIVSKIAGTSQQWFIILVKYDLEGNLVTNFGDNGVSFTETPPTFGEFPTVKDMVFTSDNSLVLRLIDGVNSEGISSMLRFTENGVHDTSVGENGYYDCGVKYSGYVKYAHSLLIGPEDEMTVAGVEEAGDFPVRIRKFDTDFAPITSYGIDGQASIIQPQPSFPTVHNIYQGINNEIFFVTSMDMSTETSGNLRVIKLTNTGEIDETFQEILQLDTTLDHNMFSFNVTSDGYLLIGGYALINGDYQLFIMCYNPDGTLNVGFGEEGYFYFDLEDELQEPIYRMQFQSNGKLVVFTGYNSSGYRLFRFNYSPFTTSIAEVEVNNSITCYPNPVENFLTIENKQGGMQKFVLGNSMGQVVHEMSMNGTSLTFDLSWLRTGVYFIRSKDAGHNFVYRFLKL